MTTIFVTLEAESCCNCGCVFGLSAAMKASLRRSGEWFHCPNGHRQHYTETTEQKLQKQLAAERARLDQANAEIATQRDRIAARDRRIAATRGVVTRIRNRVFNGVCPCCSVKFRNVEEHIKANHPDWKGIEDAGK